MNFHKDNIQVPAHRSGDWTYRDPRSPTLDSVTVPSQNLNSNSQYCCLTWPILVVIINTNTESGFFLWTLCLGLEQLFLHPQSLLYQCICWWWHSIKMDIGIVSSLGPFSDSVRRNKSLSTQRSMRASTSLSPGDLEYSELDPACPP